MKERFESIELEIVTIKAEDVIATSGEGTRYVCDNELPVIDI